MILKGFKKTMRKGGDLIIKALPLVTTVILIMHSNATACIYNGQPKPPASMKKYRKF